ncbi:MAG: radical SAM protein [Magnetococcales bacterium]|nr:radical SAM protein [Magnetococcales bacterium]
MIDRVVKAARHLPFISKPAVLERVASGYFRSLILRQDTLRSLELALTYRCQAKCHKCYSANMENDDHAYLTVTEIGDLIAQAIELGIIHVNLTGGEPTLRKDLLDVIRACQPRRVVVSLVTNALLLTRQKMADMKAAGLNTIQISLDAADAAEHDRLRGVPGCYDKVIRAGRWAHEVGLNLCFSTVLSTETSSNKRKMYDLLALCEREDAFLLICDSAAVGGWSGQAEKMMTCQERNDALAELLRHPRARHHNMYNFRGRSGCPAGVEKIYITAYGEVTPCDLVHDIAGNLKQEPLKAIWDRMRLHPLYRQKMVDCPRYKEEFSSREPLQSPPLSEGPA